MFHLPLDSSHTCKNLNIHESYKKGKEAELRFLKVINTNFLNKPYWLKRVEKAPKQYDLRGVDMLALVQLSDTEEVILPLQIKSSLQGLKAFKSDHSAYVAKMVPVVVVNNWCNDENICIRTCSLLRRIRSSGPQYLSFFEYLLKLYS